MTLPRLRFTIRAMMVVSLLFGGIIVSRRPDCCLRVVNRSGQSISHLAVILSGEQVVVENLADGSSVMVPFRGQEEPRFSIAGALIDRTSVRSGFRITGNPKRFSQVVGAVEPGGQFRLLLSR